MLLKNVRKIGKFREGNATSPLRGTTNIDINSMVDAHVPYARSTKLTDRFVIDDVSYVAQSENDSSYSNLKWAAANV